MDGHKKEGVSVKEIESYAKKHRFEVFFCMLFVLALLFSFVFFGVVWAVFAVMVGGIIGVLLSEKVEEIAASIMGFFFRQEKTTQLVLAGVSMILAIFLPPLIFFLVGAHGGIHMRQMAMELASKSRK